jgi:hypothetical protein
MPRLPLATFVQGREQTNGTLAVSLRMVPVAKAEILPRSM